MLKQFFRQPLYIQLSPDRVLVRDPRSGRAVDEIPEIALQRSHGGKLKIVAVGQAARGAAGLPGTTIHNPFAHPRSLVSDFTLAEQVLRAFARRIAQGRLRWTPNPVVILHPLGEHAGGLTQVELRTFAELVRGMGARAVQIWQGPALTDEELLADELPASGQVLSA